MLAEAVEAAGWWDKQRQPWDVGRNEADTRQAEAATAGREEQNQAPWKEWTFGRQQGKSRPAYMSTILEAVLEIISPSAHGVVSSCGSAACPPLASPHLAVQ